MTRPERLDDAAIADWLGEHAAWARDGDHLRREFRFAGFAEAMGFMTAAAVVAERLDHHPEWSNVWNRVDVGLTTHDADGITQLDLTLAERMDDLAG